MSKIDRGPYSVQLGGTFYVEHGEGEGEARIHLAGFILSDHQSSLMIGAGHDDALHNLTVVPLDGESVADAVKRTMGEEFVPGVTFEALEEQADPTWVEGWRAQRRKLALEVMDGTPLPEVEERSDGVYVAGERARQGDERENWRLVRAR